MYKLLHGDCLEKMAGLQENSVDAIVTDPPYGLSFMGKKWDYDVPSVEVWRQCLRVLKPGGHLLAFAGTRTQHRMAVNIEDAGFEIREMLAWVYGSGFPKSLNVGKAIDKAAGAERKVVATVKKKPSASSDCNEGWVRPWAEGKTTMDITAPATPEAQQWDGWGTALKPALEPITVARKPFKGTVAANVLKWSTGGLNIDGCRVEGKRWPANLLHDGSDEVVELFPQTTSGGGDKRTEPTGHKVDKGSAARFFYCAKASKRDRNEGCEGLEEVQQDNTRKEGNPGGDNPRNRGLNKRANHHPTVKPTDLMRYLCRLVTPPGGTVLDPFMGSGSTGKAAILEGFKFLGIEREAEYLAIAQARCQSVCNKVGGETDGLSKCDSGKDVTLFTES